MVAHPNSIEQNLLHLGPCRPRPVYLFICVLYNVLYNKSVCRSKMCPKFFELFHQIIKPEEGVREFPIYNQLARSTGGPRLVMLLEGYGAESLVGWSS